MKKEAYNFDRVMRFVPPSDRREPHKKPRRATAGKHCRCEGCGGLVWCPARSGTCLGTACDA